MTRYYRNFIAAMWFFGIGGALNERAIGLGTFVLVLLVTTITLFIVDRSMEVRHAGQ